jgi:hypothetical protein
MTTLLSPAVLRAAVGGDLGAFSIVATQPHGVLQECSASAGDLVVTVDAICRVLGALRSRSVPPIDVQRWASFVRRGYVAGVDRQPVRPIAIDYEVASEAAIVEVLARLDEIGDLVDGAVDDAEIRTMISGLGCA